MPGRSRNKPLPVSLEVLHVLCPVHHCLPPSKVRYYSKFYGNSFLYGFRIPSHYFL